MPRMHCPHASANVSVHMSRFCGVFLSCVLMPMWKTVEMAAEYGRSLVGGLPLLVRLLGSEDTDAQAYAAAAISMLAQDDSNVMVLTEEKVLPALAKLSTTSVDLVRKHLALAVANVCRLGVCVLPPPLSNTPFENRFHHFWKSTVLCDGGGHECMNDIDAYVLCV